MSAWPAVDAALDALGQMPPNALVFDATQARYLHHQLSQVVAIATNAVELASSPPRVTLSGEDWPERFGAAIGAAARRSQMLGVGFVDVVVPIEPRSADMIDQAEAERAKDARR